MSKLTDNLREIRRQKIQYIVPENIRQGITIYGIEGGIQEGEGGSSSIEDILYRDRQVDVSNYPYLLPGFAIDINDIEDESLLNINWDHFSFENTLFVVPKPSQDPNEYWFSLSSGDFVYIPSKHTLYLINKYGGLLWADPFTNTFKIVCTRDYSTIIKIEVPEDLTNLPLYVLSHEAENPEESIEGNVSHINFMKNDIIDEIELDQDNEKFFICTGLPIYSYKETGETDFDTGNPIYTYDNSSYEGLLCPLTTEYYNVMPLTRITDLDNYVQMGDACAYNLCLDEGNVTSGRCTIDVDGESITLNGYYTRHITNNEYLLYDLWDILYNTASSGEISDNTTLSYPLYVSGIIFTGNTPCDTCFEIIYDSYGVFKLKSCYNSDQVFYIYPMEDNIMSEENPNQVEEYGCKFFIFGDIIEGFVKNNYASGGGSIDINKLLDLTDEILYQHPDSGIPHEKPQPQPQH